MKRKWIRNPLIRKIAHVYSLGPPELANNKQGGTSCCFPQGDLVGITVAQTGGWRGIMQAVSPCGSPQLDLVLLGWTSSRLPSASRRACGLLPSMCLLGAGRAQQTPQGAVGGFGQWYWDPPLRATGSAATAHPNVWCSRRCVWSGGCSLFGGREVVFVFYHSSHLFWCSHLVQLWIFTPQSYQGTY